MAGQGEEEEAALVQRMKSILAPFVLRRLKVEVAGQLPPKSQQVCVLLTVKMHISMHSNHACQPARMLNKAINSIPSHLSMTCKGHVGYQ